MTSRGSRLSVYAIPSKNHMGKRSASRSPPKLSFCQWWISSWRRMNGCQSPPNKIVRAPQKYCADTIGFENLSKQSFVLQNRTVGSVSIPPNSSLTKDLASANSATASSSLSISSMQIVSDTHSKPNICGAKILTDFTETASATAPKKTDNIRKAVICFINPSIPRSAFFARSSRIIPRVKLSRKSSTTRKRSLVADTASVPMGSNQTLAASHDHRCSGHAAVRADVGASGCLNA